MSIGGGQQPHWSRDGAELFYVTLEGTLVSVPVKSGPAWNAGTPAPVIAADSYKGSGTTARTYDVAPDGKRFLLIKEADDRQAPPPGIVVVSNWFEELKRLVPTRR